MYMCLLARVLVDVVCLTECGQHGHVQCYINVGVQTEGRCSLDNVRYRVDSTAASFQPEFTFV